MKLCIVLSGLLLAIAAGISGCSSQSQSRATSTAANIPAEVEDASPYGESHVRTVESRWLRPVVGEEEETLGARVESVETLSENQSHAVRISLPNKSSQIEEVVVYGRVRKDEVRHPIVQPTKVEVLNTPEQNGIVIYLPELQDFVLRINYYEAPSDVVPDLITD